MSIQFTFAEAAFIGLVYWFGWCEIMSPLSNANDACMLGMIIGIYYGRIEEALVLGASIATLYFANLAVGANAPSDSALAACIAVPISLKTGLGVEETIALAVPFGVLGVFLDNFRRLFNGNFNRMAVAQIQKKDYSKLWIDQIVLPQLVNFCVRFVPLTLLLYFFGGTAGEVVASFPAWLNSGLKLIGSMLPGLGLMLCLIFMGKKELLPFFFIGYYISYFTSVGYVFIALAAVMIAVLHTKYSFISQVDDEDEEDDEEDAVVSESIYGEGHAFKSRGDLIGWTVRYLTFYRMSQCIEYFYGTGTAYMFKKPLARIYKDTDSDAYQAAMLRAASPFITNPPWGFEILTGAMAMEEDISRTGDENGNKGEAINTFKTSLMGPMAGLGDSIMSGIDFPLMKSIFYGWALQGLWIGGCWKYVWTFWYYAVGCITGVFGYEAGQSQLNKLLNSPLFHKFLYGASVVGFLMMGAMAAKYCKVPIDITWETMNGSNSMTGILNGLIPGFLPLTYLLSAYFLLNKGVKFSKLIIFTCVFGLICGIIGIC